MRHGLAGPAGRPRHLTRLIAQEEDGANDACMGDPQGLASTCLPVLPGGTHASHEAAHVLPAAAGAVVDKVCRPCVEFSASDLIPRPSFPAAEIQFLQAHVGTAGQVRTQRVQGPSQLQTAQPGRTEDGQTMREPGSQVAGSAPRRVRICRPVQRAIAAALRTGHGRMPNQPQAQARPSAR